MKSTKNTEILVDVGHKESKLCRFSKQIYKVALMLFTITAHVLSVSAISTLVSTTNMFDWCINNRSKKTIGVILRVLRWPSQELL